MFFFFFKPEPHVHIYWCVNDSHLAEVLELVQLIATAGSHDGTSMMKMIHHCSAIPLGNRDSQSFIRLFLFADWLRWTYGNDTPFLSESLALKSRKS